MSERGLVSGAPQEGERQFEAALRPRSLMEFTGQPKLKENLAIAIEAARQRGEAMDHVLLYGPPGLGKTTLAQLVALELGVPFEQTAGPVISKKLDLTGLLTNVRAREVFFIDEIHRLLPDVEEMLYSAIEDFRVDLLVGQGPGARTHSISIPRFTAVGATTKLSSISPPLRGRFGLLLRLDPYAHDDLARVRDYAQVRGTGEITVEASRAALDLLDVDRFGLDEIDQRIMTTILEKYDGGGLNTIAAAVGEEPATIEEVYEPYLIQLGFLDRTPRGRIGTPRSFEYFGVARRTRNPQSNLF